MSLERARRLTYRLIQAVCLAIVWPFTGLRVEGRHYVPRVGPLLVVSNHVNLLDIIVIGIAVPRLMTFMAKTELFRVPLLGGVMRFHLTFPVDRGAADRQAIRTALTRLEEGYPVCVFAEGTRSRSASLARGLPGAGLLALRSSAPVLPVGISGTDRPFRLWPRPTVVVRIGPPFTVERPSDGHLDSQAATDQIMYRVAEMLPPTYRGIYALPPEMLADASVAGRRAARRVGAAPDEEQP